MTIVNNKTEKKASAQTENCSRIQSAPSFLKFSTFCLFFKILLIYLLNVNSLLFFTYSFFCSIDNYNMYKRGQDTGCSEAVRKPVNICSSPMTWLFGKWQGKAVLPLDWFLLIACLVGDCNETSVWVLVDRLVLTGGMGAVTQSLEFFPLIATILCTKAFEVPTFSYRLGGYQINASTLFFFFLSLFPSVFFFFWFSPKKVSKCPYRYSCTVWERAC